MSDSSDAARYLIVNADDFGASGGVNRGIIQSHENGIVTSASLMVRAPAAAEAARYAREHRELSCGLHVDLGEWFYRDERWQPAYVVVNLDDERAVAAEIDRQYSTFRELMGTDPTHLDSHQHAHRKGPACAAVLALGERLGVPVRHFTDGITYCGRFYGQSGRGEPYPQAIAPQALVGMLAALPAGITELACHPGLDPELHSTYRWERIDEVRSLCDPSVRATVAAQGIRLRSFRDPSPLVASTAGC
jgi:chitin disaccharide deacetylase